MTEMTFRAPRPYRIETSVVGDWWQTVDRWALGALMVLFALGMIMGLAASPPLAQKNDLWTYHYVVRHAVFVAMAIGVIMTISMCSVATVRRLGAVLFGLWLLAPVALPWLGTAFGKGAVRWYSWGVFGLQPSEFLKTGFVLVAAWLMAGSFERFGPPGRSITAVMAIGIAAMLALQPDFGQAVLVLAVWTTMVFISGAPIVALLGLGGLIGAGGAFAGASGGAAAIARPAH